MFHQIKNIHFENITSINTISVHKTINYISYKYCLLLVHNIEFNTNSLTAMSVK